MVGDSPTLPALFEETIRDAQALRTPGVDGVPGGEDPFRDYFIGVKDASDLNDASSLFDKAQRTLNQVSLNSFVDVIFFHLLSNSLFFSIQTLVLHREAFSTSRADMSRCEVDLLGLSEKRNTHKLLYGQKDKEIKDL